MDTADTPAVLLLDLPASAFAGIDLLSFTTTSRFRGVKNLPNGIHFAYAGTSTAFSERHGVWFTINEAEAQHPLFITKWDPKSETLIAETSEAELLRWRANLGSIWREGLTPYRQSASTITSDELQEEVIEWPRLTSKITPALLTRVLGSDTEHCSISSASSAKRDLEDIPGLTAKDFEDELGAQLNFLPIDLKQTWRQGATGRERTDAAQDRTWALNDLIDHHCTEHEMMEVVGELQLCFLMTLTINNFSCLEQWKRLLTLVFTCRSAAATNPDLFVAVIQTLTLQLQHCKLADSGLIDLADEGGSLLKHLLVRFRKGLDGLSGIGVQDVVDELDDLEEYLRTEHGWQLGGTFVKSGVLELEDGEEVRMDTTAYDEDDETGEYAPQIVDLTPEQARLLGTDVELQALHTSMSKTSLHEATAGGSQESTSESSDGASDDHSESEDESDESEAAEDLEDMDARY